MLHVTRYGRYWAVWDAQELVVVTVYKKGAAAVLRRLQGPEAGAPAAPASGAVARPLTPRRPPQSSTPGGQGLAPGPQDAPL